MTTLLRCQRLLFSRPVVRACRGMSSGGEEVIIGGTQDTGVITLNKPKVLNALSLSMIRTIFPTLQKWEGEKSMVIIKGSEKAFCAGGDVRSITEAGLRGEDLPKIFFREEYQLDSLIGTLHIPFVALIHGITMGGGVGLSVHAQYRVATEKTLFAMPETAIGLFPDVGGSHFLPRLGGHLGLFLALTGYRLKGPDVLRAGIATHMCHSSNLAELERTLIENPASEIDNILNTFMQKSPELLEHEFGLAKNMKTVEACFAGKTVEDIINRLNGEGTDWCKEVVATLHKMSPTSLKVTLRQVKEGVSKSLQECLQMEYRLTQRCCEKGDFYEGVRSLLIDKDHTPKWKPATLGEVTESRVASFFAPLPEDQELQL